MAKNASFARELQIILLQLDITKADVARRLNVSQMHVGNLVRGTRHATPELINTMATVLALSPTARARLHRAAARDRGFDLARPVKKQEKQEKQAAHG